ncbi:glycoside hydrolase 15 protein [Oleoguttula sp. CCFEE 5521]
MAFKVAFPFVATIFARPAVLDHFGASGTSTLTSWLASESPVALQGMLNNLGSNGLKAHGAGDGVLVASPSTTDPPYFYTWTRDSALTFKTLVDNFLTYKTAGLETKIQQYIGAQAALQGVNNPSGGLCTGGLGEAKFNVDLTAFTGATAPIAYARYLISQGNTSVVTSIIWPIVQNDLSYVTQYWNQTGFDLWEEVNSASFFTTASQYRAWIEGSSLASQIGTSCPNCDSQAPLVLCTLQTYWTGSYILSNTGGGRSGKDANSLLASIHLFDQAATCDSTIYQPCSDKALANHKVVTDSFRSIYTINHGIAQGVGIAVGRYPEDVYQGGNPWYLSTFVAAEQLYDAVYQWKRIGSLSITSTSLAFFEDVYPSAVMGTYASSTATFISIVNAVSAYADSYMSNAQTYTPQNGALAEQYLRSNGTPASAVDLTWSYAAFLAAYAARANDMPASSGASSVSSRFLSRSSGLAQTSQAHLPRTCTGGSAKDPCATATKTIWTPSTTQTCSATPTLTTMTFTEAKSTNPGDTVYITGAIAQLGNWDTGAAVAMSASQYTSSSPKWFTSVSLPAGGPVSYKYFIKSNGGAIIWESDPDRVLTVPKNCAGTTTQNDSWR